LTLNVSPELLAAAESRSWLVTPSSDRDSNLLTPPLPTLIDKVPPTVVGSKLRARPSLLSPGMGPTDRLPPTLSFSLMGQPWRILVLKLVVLALVPRLTVTLSSLSLFQIPLMRTEGVGVAAPPR